MQPTIIKARPTKRATAPATRSADSSLADFDMLTLNKQIAWTGDEGFIAVQSSKHLDLSTHVPTNGHWNKAQGVVPFDCNHMHARMIDDQRARRNTRECVPKRWLPYKD